MDEPRRSFPARMIRWVFRTVLLVGGPIAIAIAGLVFYMSTGRYVTTENAYIKSELITVTAEVAGKIIDLAVGNNQQVSAGDLLFRIDPQRFEIELEQARAELGAARQRVAALKARLRTKTAELEWATKDAEFMQGELERFERLRSGKTISETRLVEVRREAARTSTRISVIKEEISEARAGLGGDPDRPVDEHPEVLRALADMSRAQVDLDATAVHAPSDAITANLRLQIGEYVDEAEPVLSLVAADAVWVEANLKETDLTHLHVGQSATLRVDAYPDIEWMARIDSLSPATGAEYALLPPQNASGNWVKVVQRVPVRLEIDVPPDGPRLRAGMSVAVSIDTEFKRPLPEVLSSARAWIRPVEQD